MLKKATVLLIVFTLIVSFSMTAFASGATVIKDGNSITIYTPANPPAHGYEEGTGNGHGPHNPLYVAGE